MDYGKVRRLIPPVKNVFRSADLLRVIQNFSDDAGIIAELMYVQSSQENYKAV